MDSNLTPQQQIIDTIQALAHEGTPAVDNLRDLHIQAMVEAGHSSTLTPVITPERKHNVFASYSLKAAVGAVAVLTATSGLAFAGVLPNSAQDALANAAAKAGISVPHSDNAGQKEQLSSSTTESTETSSDDTSSTDEQTETTGDEATTTDEQTPAKVTHGSAVSAVAKDTSLRGREHGKAVSAIASQHGAQTSAAHSNSHSNSGSTGKPDTAGNSGNHGKPDSAGKPESAGKPDSAGKPESPGNSAAHGGGKHN